MVGESDQTAELRFAISKCRFGAIDPLDKPIDSTEQIRRFIH
jgi:FixJ family two-component response regulator